jgi:opacity protein-like surface antigen
MKKFIYLVFATGILLIWGSGLASAEDLNNYASFKIGQYHLAQGSYDKPNGFEVAIGHMFNSNVGVELGYGKYIARKKDSGSRPAWLNLSQPALGRWKEYESLEISPLTLSLKVVSSNDYSVAYLAGGIGAYFVDYEAGYKTELEGNARYTDSDTVYGIHLETGLGYNTLENVYLGIAFRYVATEATHMKKEVLGLTADQEDHLSGYAVTGEVSLKF